MPLHLRIPTLRCLVRNSVYRGNSVAFYPGLTSAFGHTWVATKFLYDAQRSNRRYCKIHELWQIRWPCSQVCDIGIERLGRYKVNEASCSHEASSFNDISMGFIRHDLYTTANNQHSCLQMGWYPDFTPFATQILPCRRSAAVVFRMYFDFFSFAGNCTDDLLRLYNGHWSRMPRDDLSL